MLELLIRTTNVSFVSNSLCSSRRHFAAILKDHSGRFITIYTLPSFSEKPYFFGTDYSEQLIVYPEEEHTINFCKPTNYCYIEWYRDDKEINMTDDGRVRSLDSKHEVLKLSYPLSSDSGIFKCVAWNNMGSVERHANVIVYTSKSAIYYYVAFSPPQAHKTAC